MSQSFLLRLVTSITQKKNAITKIDFLHQIEAREWELEVNDPCVENVALVENFRTI